MIIKYTVAWILLALFGVINGVLRELGYKKLMREHAAHQVSSLSALVLIGLITWALSWIMPLASAGQAWTVGLVWLAMTVCFEFLFGHFAMKLSWERLLADYNLLEGRLWLLVLLWIGLAPWVVFQLTLRS